MISIFATSRSLLGLAAVGIVAVVWFLVSTVVSYRKLRHIPGPRLAQFSQLWLFNVSFKGDLYLAMEEVLRKYGTISSSISALGTLSSNRIPSEDWP